MSGPRTRANALSALLSILPTFALAQPSPEPGALFVTYRSASSVYVSAGQTAGLAVGERLTVVSGKDVVAELEVGFVADHSASCKVLRETRPVKVGDRVRRAAGAAVLTPARPPPAGTPAPAPQGEAIPDRPGGARSPVITGGVSAGWSGFFDGGGNSDRGSEERDGRFDLGVTNLGTSAIAVRARGAFHQSLRGTSSSVLLPRQEDRTRLFELSLAYQPAGGRFARVSAMVGRLGATPFVSLGYLDGGLVEIRLLPNVHIGGFAGRAPDLSGFGTVAAGNKDGLYTRLGQGPASVVGAVVREGGSGSRREYGAVESQLRRGRLWLRQRAEIDFRGEAVDATGQAVLSEARVVASWRHAPGRTLSASYERHRDLGPSYRAFRPEELLDRNLQQVLRLDLDLSGVRVGGSIRTRGGDGGQTYAVHAGAGRLRMLGFLGGGELSAYSNPLTRGALGTARLSRDIGGRHQVEVSFTTNAYQPRLAGGFLLSHWLRAGGYGQIGAHTFVRGEIELSAGHDLRGVRVRTEAGYRF